MSTLALPPTLIPRRSATYLIAPARTASGWPDAPFVSSFEVAVLGDELAGDEGRALGVLADRGPGPRGIDRSGDDFAAEFACLRRGRVRVVDAEGDAPMGRRFGVVGCDRIQRGDDVDEAVGGVHLRHLVAQARSALLEVISIAGKRPHD